LPDRRCRRIFRSYDRQERLSYRIPTFETVYQANPMPPRDLAGSTVSFLAAFHESSDYFTSSTSHCAWSEYAHISLRTPISLMLHAIARDAREPKQSPRPLGSCPEESRGRRGLPTLARVSAGSAWPSPRVHSTCCRPSRPPTTDHYTLSPSVDVPRGLTGSFAPHFQPAISGMSSPCF
jgi:hypothetical protein